MISKTDARIGQMRACIQAILESYRFPAVEVLTAQVDRVTVKASDGFKEHLIRLVRQGHFKAWAFNRNHGTTADLGFREVCWKCSTQMVHHTSGVWEIDVDEYNPDYGALPAMQHLFLEVMTPGKTNPFAVRKGLIKRGIAVPLIESTA